MRILTGLLFILLALSPAALSAQEYWESGRYFFDLIHPDDLRGYRQLQLRDSAAKETWTRRKRWHFMRDYTLDSAGRPILCEEWRYFNHKELDFLSIDRYDYHPDGTYETIPLLPPGPPYQAAKGSVQNTFDQGRLSEVRYLDSKGKIYRRKTYAWSPDGERLLEIEYWWDNLERAENAQSSIISHYDSLGRLTSWNQATPYSSHITSITYHDKLVIAISENVFLRDIISKTEVHLDENDLPQLAVTYSKSAKEGAKEKWERRSQLTFYYVR